MTETSQGPFCTQILADYGAEVLKVENPKGGVCPRLSFFGPVWVDLILTRDTG